MRDQEPRSLGLLTVACLAFLSCACAAPCAFAQIPSWGVIRFTPQRICDGAQWPCKISALPT
jgi:hypothetical protein